MAVASLVVSLMALVCSVVIPLYIDRRADPRIRVEVSTVGLAHVGNAVQVKVINDGRAAARIEYWGVVDMPSGTSISWAFFEDATQLSHESIVPPHDSLPLYMPAMKLKEALEALGSSEARVRGRVLTSTGRWHPEVVKSK
jgi:hypothetical protein